MKMIRKWIEALRKVWRELNAVDPKVSEIYYLAFQND